MPGRSSKAPTVFEPTRCGSLRPRPGASADPARPAVATALLRARHDLSGDMEADLLRADMCRRLRIEAEVHLRPDAGFERDVLDAANLEPPAGLRTRDAHVVGFLAGDDQPSRHEAVLGAFDLLVEADLQHVG